ncbi:MAG TPA: redoxin domain-containing protein [Ferruginibacter sp.]|nr:redoxin domain-containing protein [Ferruginibacter sp.]
MIKTKLQVLIFFLLLSFCSKSQTYDKQYEICSQSLRKLVKVDSLYFELVKERDSCLVGTSAPNFKVTTIDNQEFELSKLKGRVVVLNFWFTRCQPCIKEMPELNRLVTHYTGKKVTFISFAPEDSITLKTFFITHPFNFAIVPKSEKVRSEEFKLFSAWPYSIIIDREGKIFKMWAGATENIMHDYTTIIDKLLN